MLQEKIIAEIKQIPDEKLAEIYDLVHYFRLGLLQESQTLPVKQRPIGLGKDWCKFQKVFLSLCPRTFSMALKANNESSFGYLYLFVADIRCTGIE
jgi:hypothetical protein